MTDNVQALIAEAWGMMTEAQKYKLCAGGMQFGNTYKYTGFEDGGPPDTSGELFWRFEEMMGKSLSAIVNWDDCRISTADVPMVGYDYEIYVEAEYKIINHTDRPTALMMAVVDWLEGRGR